jgi:hypothetical protein
MSRTLGEASVKETIQMSVFVGFWKMAKGAADAVVQLAITPSQKVPEVASITDRQQE